MMPGMGRMNPRMMKKLQKQLQSATEELDATEVIIRTKDKELYDLAKNFIMYDRFDQKMKIGINLRMPEINALLALSLIHI